MKKAIYLLMMCAGVLLASCEKDEIGSTATKAVAGEWTVTVDAVDANGAVLLQDPFGLGHTMLFTYNTAANIPTEMYVDDMEEFWDYKVKVKTDVNALTFATEGAAPNEKYDCNVTIDSGKILLGAATTPHGTPADSIVFYVSFSDDENAPAAYAKLKVAGYRYSGLASDE
ncbi:lipid-binding protein [Bacteroides sp.]|uniref:lipid-binding protein n=1 Tax=Bacteroides sp. TaxID=29523 RepID=UPI003AB20167